MRCPKCEQWNRSSLPRCTRCGTELNGTPVEPSWRSRLKGGGKAYIRVDEDGHADVTPDRRDVLAEQMAEFKVRVDEGARRKQQLMTDTMVDFEPVSAKTSCEAPADTLASADDADAADVPVEEAEAPAAPSFASETPKRSARVAIHGLPATGTTAPAISGQPAIPRGTMTPAQWQDNRSYDPQVEAMLQQNLFRNAPAVPQHKQNKTRSRHRSKRLFVNILTGVLSVVVLALAIAVIVPAYKSYQASKAGNETSYVSASMKDDQAAHTILIRGEEGQKIHIRELHRNFEVINGFATIVIPDHEWYEALDVVTEETMTVTLAPSYQTSGGRQKPLEPITYEIDIPESPIELVSPQYSRLEVATPMYSMEFKVRPGSIVTINGEDMSDAVDETGKLVYNASVQPKGDNVYTVNVRSPYCRDNTMEVILYRQVQEIPLDLAVTTYSTTNESKYTISCTTLPGAEVSVLSAHSDLNITKLETTGEFTFIALLQKYGNNKVIIQATYPGKKTSRIEYDIYYLPNVDEYTRKAWSLTRAADYAELMGNISARAERSQIYVAMGQIDHFVSDDPQIAVMYCSEDGTSQPVRLTNESKTVWEKGKYYRIYADVYGSYNNMPWLIARYTYVD